MLTNFFSAIYCFSFAYDKKIKKFWQKTLLVFPIRKEYFFQRIILINSSEILNSREMTMKMLALF